MHHHFTYRYSLEEGSKKFKCPACGRKRFVRYIDKKTSQYLSLEFGRCDREISCGYHKSPGKVNTEKIPYRVDQNRQKNKEETVSELPSSLVEKTLRSYNGNKFIKWMSSLPGWSMKRAVKAAKRYKVGTGKKKVAGWPIFWQIDRENRVRSGKLIKYNSKGHRVRNDDEYCIDWIHSILKRTGKIKNFELEQCLFGLHLVDGTKPCAIVESEKTAILCSEYLPEYEWLAAGALHGLSESKLSPLRGLDILLFPDQGGFPKWKRKEKYFQHIGKIKVSDLFQRKNLKNKRGMDLADALIEYDIINFLKIRL